MKKISRTDAYQRMNDIAFKVMDQELEAVFHSDQRKDREMTHEFFLDHDGSIVLEMYWDGRLVQTLRLHGGDSMNKDYSRFVSKEKAYREMKELLEQRLGRELTELEDRKIQWFADCEYETIGVFVDLFIELSEKEGNKE
ncbi:hypothetical protein [Bacillus sp. FJAT-47783]|uniref:hypothetical protein n=1 Tax=Bacillus sp. FJAT-47783 TaxID=2922712 RepID=UPI001FACC84D|nr:hypothetical protein [Bacillus sp. FJAT-47783]